jgi:hypothetical protein
VRSAEPLAGGALDRIGNFWSGAGNFVHGR